MKKSGFIKDALILFLITLISGFCLGLVYDITQAPIASAKEKAKEAAFKQVFADAETFSKNEQNTDLIAQKAEEIAGLGLGNVEINEIVDALDAGGDKIGHVVTVTSNDGYGGAIKLSVGITNEGSLNGIAFLTIGETAGLGMNALKPEFHEQFNGKTAAAFTVVKTDPKDDAEISAISGATITSKAVVAAVNAAVYFTQNCVEN